MKNAIMFSSLFIGGGIVLCAGIMADSTPIDEVGIISCAVGLAGMLGCFIKEIADYIKAKKKEVK